MNDDWVDEEFTVKCHNCGSITVKPKGKHWIFCPNCKTALDIMDRHEEIRWYKGKYKVKVLVKGKKPKGVKHCPVTWLVEALEPIPLISPYVKHILHIVSKGDTLVTVPRLLWKHPKEVEQK